MPLKYVFIACYRLGFRLLNLQVIGVFMEFGRFLDASRSQGRRRPRGGAPRPLEPFWRASEPFLWALKPL